MNLPAARLIALVPSLMLSLTLAAQQPPKADLGLFEEHADVGGPAKAGSVAFDAAAKTYKIAGGGTNMWANADAFHFVWKKMSGDVSLAADAAFPTPGGDPHRKAVLIIRQTLDADSPYVDAALHGDGLTSLQYRETKGGRTSEVQANVKGPKRLRIEKRGQDVSLWVAGTGEELKRSGATIRLKLDEPLYVGLGVCAHNNAAIETAVFSNVELGVPPAAPAPLPGAKPQVLSTLETITIASKDRRVVRNFDELIEARSALLQQQGADLSHPRGRRRAHTDRHRLRHAVQQRPRPVARRHAAGDQRPVAGGAQVDRLHRPRRRRHADARDGGQPVLLARVVTGRQDDCLLRRA